MGARFRFMTTALIVLVVLVIVGGYWFHWDWTVFNGYNKVTIAHTISGTNAGTVIRTDEYQPGKGLWDWLQLLIIPLALAIIAIFFNRAERKNEQRIASDNQQEAALQEYIKEMSELLLHEKLRESQPVDVVRTIAHVRTLTVLLRLDKERKKNVLKFLYESGLIEKDESLVKLFGANFSKIVMFRADMSNLDLSGVILTEANLGGVYLQGTNLHRANLTKAVLSMSKPNKTNLSTSILSSTTLSVLNRMGRYYMSGMLAGMADYVSESTLIGINLSYATLNEADLRGSNLTKVDLQNSFLLKAKLQSANLSGANLSYAILIEAKLQHANLSEANLQHAILVKAKLQLTKLIEANLQEADLFGANLRGADLTKADLNGAKLTFANLERAIVTPQQLEKVKTLKGAIMPNGDINP